MAGRYVAIKEVKLSESEQQPPQVDNIAKEIFALKSCQHPNIVEFVESYNMGGELWIVTEHMDAGRLSDIIQNQVWGEDEIGRICLEVSSTLG